MICFVSSAIGDLFLFGISPELFSVQQIGYMLNDFPFIVAVHEHFLTLGMIFYAS
jgi:hypothetical protein